jgi:hypothetical protein
MKFLITDEGFLLDVGLAGMLRIVTACETAGMQASADR